METTARIWTIKKSYGNRVLLGAMRAPILENKKGTVFDKDLQK